MGASGYDEETLREHIPAMVYTLYDGYYIYGKYLNYDNQNNAIGYNYGLKPYIYYSCRYFRDINNNFVVNYTLDNSISIYGKIRGNYVTKSGYVINPDLVTSVIPENVDIIFNRLLTYNPNKYGDLEPNNYIGTINYPLSVVYDGTTISREVLTEQITIKEEQTADKIGTYLADVVNHATLHNGNFDLISATEAYKRCSISKRLLLISRSRLSFLKPQISMTLYKVCI